jgi:alpha-D-ribose 1-methylphosphonate 5-phosphate C-P lyase
MHAASSPAATSAADHLEGYNYAFLDELSKKAVRRALLKGVAIPGYQVPFGSRELPMARGWGTGGLQITLSMVGPGDVLKVIDQGADEGVNAVNIRRLVERTSPGVSTTLDTAEATLIQTRHRIPEQPLREDQVMIFQVPQPEPLRKVEWREQETRRMHAEADYSRM